MSIEDAQSSNSAATEKDRVYLINRVVGQRYEVLEFVGEGPLLAAFRSRDQQLNRIVTLKVLRSEHARRSDLIESLRTGWAETLSLSHSGIARSYDVGEDVALTPLYHAEEFVRGIDLKERIKRAAPFQLTAAVDIAISVAESLEYAHQRGIAHGDLCPHNILIGPEAQVKLSGFGTAATHALLARDDTSVLMRMAHYAAPDLPVGSLATASADLYALAVILFEMLTGETPFKGDNPVQIALRHAQEIPPSPRSINLATPRALEGVILKGLAKRPQDRYLGATELLADLRQIREALRFGRSLAWSPLDGNDARSEAITTAAAVPTVSDTASVEGRRVSRAVATDEPTLPENKTRGKGKDKGQDEIMQDDTAPAPRRTGGILLAINLTLLLALIGSGALVFNWIRPFLSPANQVVVPELRGKSLTEAKALANEGHFKLAIQDSVFMDDKPANTIYQQKEQPGAKILEGKEVTIWVSKGPEMVLIPNVEEMTLDKAQKELEKIGLKVGTISRRFDPITPAGVVLEQLPRSDGMERRERGKTIDLTLSKGPEPEPTPEPTPPPTPEPVIKVTPEPDMLPDPEDTRQRTFRVPYRTPQDGQQHHVVIQIEDSEGTHTGYDKMHGPGQTVTTEVTGVGRPITIKLYDNDDLKAQTLAVKGR